MSQEKQDTKPIEEYFPVHELNRIADKESKSKQNYRPVLYMHKWWARRLGSVFRTILLYSLADENMQVVENDDEMFSGKKWDGDPKSLWDFYLEDVNFGDKVVLDPFFGGGTTIVEALRMGCNVVGSELNPVAWFITKKEIEPVNVDKLDEAFNVLEQTIAPEIKQYYKTSCPHCKHEADVMYFFWVKVLPCLNCGSEVPLFKSYLIASIRPQKVLDEKLNGSKSGYWIYCPECSSIFPESNYRAEADCPNCSHSFYPAKGNASGKYYYCPDPTCGQKEEIIEAVHRKGKPEERMYAIEYYCSNCDKNNNPILMNGKGYKAIDKKDLQLFQKAKNEFIKIEDQLRIPDQDIPKGKETHPRLQNHGYKKFKELFNLRQLLNLGKIINGIQHIQDQNIKEYLLIALTTSLDYNNTFCGYNKSKNHSINLFGHHAYYPANTPVEGNVWGLKYGMGGFNSNYNSVRKGIEYKYHPFEKYRKDNKTLEKDMGVKIEGKLVDGFENLGKNGNVFLRCGDSSFLPITDEEVDAVITDPPYFGQLMYAELADFFYVWLRLLLKNDYEYFNAKLTPKSSEVVQNPKQGKGEQEYTDGLTSVFKESSKKLKDNGILVFTFHHGKTEAWSSVLKSVLSSGFYVSSVYPIQAEMSESMHIRDKGNIEYDMIIVCRKRGAVLEKHSWEKIYDRIYFKAQDTIKKLETESERLAQGDMFVITMGKCLEEYSKHYPEVYADGKQLSVQDALDDIRAIVDTHFMEGRFDEFQRKLDTPSAAYLTFLATGSDEMSYTSLNKRLQQRAISIEDLLKWGLAKQEGSKIVKLSLKDRAEVIKQKKPENVSAIDRAHYIQYLKEVKDDPAAIGDWASDDAVKALDELSKLQKSKDLKELKDFIEQKEYTKTQAKQERLL